MVGLGAGEELEYELLPGARALTVFCYGKPSSVSLILDMHTQRSTCKQSHKWRQGIERSVGLRGGDVRGRVGCDFSSLEETPVPNPLLQVTVPPVTEKEQKLLEAAKAKQLNPHQAHRLPIPLELCLVGSCILGPLWPPAPPETPRPRAPGPHAPGV